MKFQILLLLLLIYICNSNKSPALPKNWQYYNRDQQIRKAWNHMHEEGHILPTEDINKNGIRNDRKYTNLHVKHPTTYWDPVNRPNYRIQKLGYINDPVRHDRYNKEYKMYRTAHNPPTSTKPTRELIRNLHKNHKYIGEWLGVGRDMELPVTGHPKGYQPVRVKVDDKASQIKTKAAAKVAAVTGAASGEGASFKELRFQEHVIHKSNNNNNNNNNVNNNQLYHQRIKIPVELVRQAGKRLDPLDGMFDKAPKLVAPPDEEQTIIDLMK